MNLLLDTHALLWALFDDPRLKNKQRDILQDVRNRIFVSAVSVFEISTKVRIGKLPEAEVYERDIESLAARFDYSEVNITVVHAALAGRWKSNHRDPFDRLLAAQSLIEGIPLLTSDPVFSEFEVITIW